jgi:hypothetical protein
MQFSRRTGRFPFFAAKRTSFDRLVGLETRLQGWTVKKADTRTGRAAGAPDRRGDNHLKNNKDF